MSKIISRYMKDNWIIGHFQIVYFLNRLWWRLGSNSDKPLSAKPRRLNMYVFPWQNETWMAPAEKFSIWGVSGYILCSIRYIQFQLTD